MPNFTDNKVDRAYENFMKQVPGFQRDPLETKTNQKDIQKKIKKGAVNTVARAPAARESSHTLPE